MAIALEGTVTGSTTSGTSFTLTSWTPLANELILLAVAVRNESVVVSASGNGFSVFEQVADVDNVQGQTGITLFRAMKSTAPSTGQITVNLPANSEPALAVAIRLSDVDTSGSDGSGAVETFSTEEGPDPDDDDMLDLITTLTDEAWAIAFGTHRLASFTLPGGETAISINNTVGSGGDETTLSAWYQTTPTAGEIQLGEAADLDSDRDWCMIIASVKPGGLIVEASAGTLAISGPQATIDAPTGVFVIATVGTLAISGPQATIVPGPSSIIADYGELDFSAAAAEIFAPEIAATPANLTVTAVSGTETRISLLWDWIKAPSSVAASAGTLAISGPQATIDAPAPFYYVDYDYIDDFIQLPDGEGDEPTTAIFLEAFVLWDQVADNLEHAIICRGQSATFAGYMWGFEAGAARIKSRFYLNGPGGADFTFAGAINPPETYPLYLSVGYDGSYFYFFCNGALAHRAARSGSISYAGDQWYLGNVAGGSLWRGKGKWSMIRVSNTCRYTADYTPPASLSNDANTIYLAKHTEGSGTSLADSSAGAHTGTFKASGEPAWVATPADLATLHSDDDMWTSLQAMISHPTDANVFIHKTDSDNYEIFSKVHATGPKWQKIVIGRWGSGPLFVKAVYVGTPTPADDDPTSWTSDPSTILSQSVLSSNEYAHYINYSGDTSFYGVNHGNETKDTEGWKVGGVTWAPGGDDVWTNGTTVQYSSTSHFVAVSDGSTNLCDVTRDTYWDRSLTYFRHVCDFDWNQTVNFGTAYAGMADLDTSNLPTVTFQKGGTDYDVSGSAGDQGEVRTDTVAAWNASSEIVRAIHMPSISSVRYYGLTNQRAFVQDAVAHGSGKGKIYLTTINNALATSEAFSGDTWNTEVWHAVYDNAGNHFLKTT